LVVDGIDLGVEDVEYFMEAAKSIFNKERK
jgi:hypothetical protein